MRCSKMSCLALPGPAASGYSKTAYCVSGNCWSSSKKYLPPRQATRPGWVVDAQAPAGDVDVVDAVVADVAAAEVVPPAPDAGQQVRPVGDHRGGADPEVEVEVRRRRRRLRLADRARAAGCSTPWRPARRRSRRRGRAAIASWTTGRAAALRADLEELARAGHGLGHQPPLADVVAARLLDVDVLAGVQAPGSRPARASGRAWRSRRRPRAGRRGPGAGPRRPSGPCPSPTSTTAAAVGQPVAIDVADVGDLDVAPGRQEAEVIRPHPPAPIRPTVTRRSVEPRVWMPPRPRQRFPIPRSLGTSYVALPHVAAPGQAKRSD